MCVRYLDSDNLVLSMNRGRQAVCIIDRRDGPWYLREYSVAGVETASDSAGIHATLNRVTSKLKSNSLLLARATH